MRQTTAKAVVALCVQLLRQLAMRAWMALMRFTCLLEAMAKGIFMVHGSGSPGRRRMPSEQATDSASPKVMPSARSPHRPQQDVSHLALEAHVPAAAGILREAARSDVP